MSHNTSSNAHSSSFPPYSEKDMILSEDEEESATLAEPMTLEGAKQLAQSSGRVDTPAQTPPLPSTLTPPLAHALPSASPSPHSHLASPSPSSLHHLSSPPLAAHHHSHTTHGARPSIHSLASPPHHPPNPIHPHLTSPHHPLTSPPHPHLAPLHHHDHPLWVSPTVTQEEEEVHEGEELPSTVDIQAIRDSPSPDPTSDKLVTIDENWATLEEQVEEDQEGVAAEEDDDEGSAEEDEEESDEDEESYFSGSDTNLSDAASTKAVSAMDPCRSERSRSRSRSVSQSDSCDSKSESDSQDSDSDTSEHSSSEGSATSSLDEDEEEDDNAVHKPLPRMKPQLTASNSQVSKKLSNICQRDGSSLIAKGKLMDVKSPYAKRQPDKVAFTSKDAANLKDVKDLSNTSKEKEAFAKFEERPIKISSDPIPTKASQPPPSPHLSDNVSFKSEEEMSLSGSDETLSNNDDGRTNACNDAHLSKASPEAIHKAPLDPDSGNKVAPKEKITESLEESKSAVEGTHLHLAMEGLKEETLALSKSQDNSKMDVQSEVGEDCSEKLQDKKAASSNCYSLAEMEERRLQKERQMDKEFDRLLKSTKPLSSLHDSKGLTEISLEGIPVANVQTKALSPIKKNKYSNGVGRLVDVKAKSVSNDTFSVANENRRSVENNSELKLNALMPKTTEREEELYPKVNRTNNEILDKKNNTLVNHKSYLKSEFKEASVITKEQISTNGVKLDSLKKPEAPNSKLMYYSSDSKSNYPSCSSSLSSSSDSEDSSALKMQTSKRIPSLNVTAKVVSDLDSKSRLKSLKHAVNSKRNGMKKKNLPKESQSPHSHKSKSPPDKSGCNSTPEKGFNNIRPTIADLVKVRERRSSLDKETSSGNEKEQDKKVSKQAPLKNSDISKDNDDETASSSEASEDLNEKVDLDTELTQTFSVSENNFNQGRLTMKIAAMKMAKFGKTGLREVTNCGLPTRSDLHSSPIVNISSAFKRPRILPLCRGGVSAPPHSGASSSAVSRSEPHKVKTAAERKTYVDALPPCSSYCTLKGKKKKGAGTKADMRVPATSLSRSGGVCTSSSNGGFGFSSGSQSFHHSHHHGNQYHQNHYLHAGGAHTEDDEEQISRLAHHLSQISHDHIGDGLQVLDQEDLAAILSDASPPQTPSPAVPLDPFPDAVGLDQRKTSSEDESDESSQVQGAEELPDLSVREAINSISLLTDTSSLSHVNSSFGESLNECAYPPHTSSGGHSNPPKLAKHTRTRKPESFKHTEDNLSERRRNHKSKPHCHSHKDNSLEDDPDTPTMPELESYAGLDCNASNVSPDSGIQSVNGSPLHHVGSPSHHHSPFYSSSVLSVGTGNPGPSSSNNESIHGKSSNESASNNNSNLRSFSPSLSLQDSPPPPTLLPAVTPPHLVGSPRYNYDDSPNSPQMPSLKCQVDPPPWEEKNPNSNLSSLEEQGTLNEKGPGRPPEETSKGGNVGVKPKRPRGRPKGSKNKKKLEENLLFQVKEKRPIESFIKEPNNSLAKLDKINRSGQFAVSDLDYSAMKHKWRGAIVDPDDFPPPTESTPLRRRKPGRPKKMPPTIKPELGGSLMMAYGLNTLDKKPAKNSISESLELKVKRPVGRPRKIKSTVEETSNRPVTLASKKCFSEKIMHKIINENVRNSEKSDKLSVQHLDDQVLNENGRSSEKSDKLTLQQTNSKETLNVETRASESSFSYKENSPSKIFPTKLGSLKVRSNDLRDQTDPYLFQDSTTSGTEDFRSEMSASKETRKKRLKSTSDGIPLDEKKRRRGRKKELPAIFEKVYGSIKNINLKNEAIKPTVTPAPLTKAKKKKKKHKKPFKSKHKNIVDPVFLAQVEELIAEVQKCCISKSPLFPQPKPGEVLLPSIFRIRKVTFNIKKRRGNEKPKTSDKESGTEGEGNKEKIAGKRKKKLQEIPKQGRERSEANEQRLPLKKRHRHISTAVPTSPDPPKIESSKMEVINMKVTSEKEKMEKEKGEKLDGKDKISSTKSPTEISRPIKTESKGTKPSETSEASATEHKDYNPNSNSVEIIAADENLKENLSQNRQKSSETVDKAQASIEEEVEPQNDHKLDELEKKQDSYLPSLVTTTPKKRHRLEAELASTTVIAPTVTTTASLTATVTTSVINSVPSTLIPMSGSSKSPLPSSKVKQERETRVTEKEASTRTPSSRQTKEIPPEKTEQVMHDTKQTELRCDESKCIVVIEKCDNLGFSEANKKVLTSLPQSEDKEETAKVAEDAGGTHSDSDIPSEHEPLCESDQSGFMSDKEGPKEMPKKVSQKRRKKKRDLRSPKVNKITTRKTEDDAFKENECTSKKRTKRRKTNKTGFPTIRRKKKKKIDPCNKDSKEEESAVAICEKEAEIDTLKSSKERKEIDSSAINQGDCLKDEKTKESTSSISTDLSQEKVKDEKLKLVVGLQVPKPRGRPKKIKPVDQASTIENKAANKAIPPVSKDLREILRGRKNDKTNENNSENKAGDNLDADPATLQKILEKVANGRSRRKRDLSEESSKIFMDRKKSRRIGEDEPVEDSDSNLISSEYQISSEPVSSDESSRCHRGKKKVPRWKKRYLIAGLLSDYYKLEEPPRKNGEITLTRCRFNYEPENHIYGLLPPPSYCKKWLRERQVDFLLPYDLWWLHTHNMLPGRDPVPSWNFRRIKSNIYYDVRPPNHDSEIQACNCRRPTKPGEKGCFEDCINRMMFIECSPHTCPIKETCSNQRIQRHETLAQLQRFMTADKGWGIKSKVEIKQGTFILEYVGEVVSEKEFKHRMQTKYSNDTHHYCLNLDRGMVIDGHRMGGDCRFVNHSCNPNCEMQKWYVNGQYRMGLFALQDIDIGEELSYDYNFSLFNPTEGQPCKCGAEHCRGVIGGRSQRLNAHQPGDEKKKSAGRNKKEICKKRKRGASTDTEGSCISKSQYPVKPLSHQQRLFILAHRCFLLRNLERIKRTRDRLGRVSEKKLEEIPEAIDEPCNKIQKFLTHFTALNTARSVKTRRLAQAEDDPEMTRVAKLAQIFKDIYDKLVASRDDKEKPLATPFMNLPSKKKYPNYYTRIGEPIDLSLIEKNILTGHYATAEAFDRDIMRLFANNLRFFGRNTEVGQMAVGLRKVYSECKLQFKPLLEEVLGEDQLPHAFANCTPNEEFEDEDVIRCVCNLHRDEGMMIQCEQCLVWQHCDCMGVADDSPDHYLCEECSPRLVSPEVPMTPQPSDSPKDKYFITLLRDNLQIKLGDSVYILRDRPSQKSGERRQPAYKLAKDMKQHELLIFKVENLWIDQKGDKFAFGHHYLMPHETFHEPWRKFFPNEVIRSPICDIIPIDMIINHCWVMDLSSYCRGRPIGTAEEHVYVCEYRVDKSARVFSKISKPKYPICTKPYAFITFSQKLRPQRTYTPHEVISNCRSRATTKATTAGSLPCGTNVTPKVETTPTNCTATVAPTASAAPLGEATSGNTSSAPNSRPSSGTRKSRSCSSSKNSDTENPEAPSVATSEAAPTPSVPPPTKIFTRQSPAERTKKRMRINRVATKLLKQLPTKGAVDLGYLLETGKRLRKKTAAFSS